MSSNAFILVQKYVVWNIGHWEPGGMFAETPLYKTWRLTFDFKPMFSPVSPDWESFIHFTDDLEGGVDQRVLGFWFIPHTLIPRLHYEMNGDGETYGTTNYFDFHDADINMWQWNSFALSQERVQNGSFVLSVNINGKQFDDVINESPRDYKNLQLHAGKHWEAVTGLLGHFELYTSTKNHRKFLSC